MTQPTIEKVITKLKMVLEEKLTREEVADWAWKYVTDDSLVLEDKKLRDLLDRAAGVDMPVSPGKYLFHEEELRAG